MSLRNITRNFSESWAVGGGEFSAPDGFIQFRGNVAAAAGAARYSRLARSDGAASHAVSALRTFRGLRLLFRAAAAGVTFSFRYADNDLGSNSAVVPDNPVSLDNTASTGTGVLITETANVLHIVEYFVVVPAGKFLYVVSTSASDLIHLLFQGVEVAE